MTADDQLSSPDLRLRIIGVLLIAVALIIGVRVFYLQIIRAESYQRQAQAGQTTELTIQPKRGVIYALDGSERVPLVLNERKWLIFADATFIKDTQPIVNALAEINLPLTLDQVDKLKAGTSRYVVLAKLQTDAVKQSLEEKDLEGLYFQESSTRNYTEHSLASQTLGFVNVDGQGQYGLEQQYNDQLGGSPGQLKAVTDNKGVPLAFERSNIAIEPVNGQDLTLTLDVGIQQIAEGALKSAVDRTGAKSGSAVVLDASNGALRALANYPSFDPNMYSLVDDISLFGNRAISDTFEPGSVMKVPVFAASLNEGVASVDGTFYDPNQVVVDGATIKNALDYGAATRPMLDIISMSLNTGTVHLLALLGGGELNEQGRTKLYGYLSDDFRFGRKTGINLPGEESGTLFGPNEGFGRNLRYANMTFGQGLTVTTLQLAGAYGSIFNGGTYYKPYVVHAQGDKITEPEVLASNILGDSAAEGIRDLMRRHANINLKDVLTPGLEVSGKTGTAQIADSQGGYLEDGFTGTYAGYVKSADKTMIIVVRIDQPQGVRFAGSGGAAPMWKQIVTDIINTGKVN